MSHVTTAPTKIVNLQALELACKELGLELRRGQTTYRWYGRHVGDYPLPEGFTREDLGKCAHAISVPGNDHAYEIGVVQNKNGQGYTLMYDFYAKGYGLMDKVSNKPLRQDCDALKVAYAKHTALLHAKKLGLVAVQRVRADGSLAITLE
jgi:hypothetical protein